MAIVLKVKGYRPMAQNLCQGGFVRACYKNHASRRERAAAIYQRDKDAILAKSKAEYESNEALREAKKARALRRYAANRESIIEYQKQYKIDNPENAAFWSNTRRCRLKNAADSYTKEEWADRLEEFNYCCAYCLKHESEVGGLSVDHMTSLSQGGTNDINNLVPSCRPCNSSKNGKTLLEFLAFKWKKQHT